jgi:superfamily I DNA/RNA helicase
MSNMVLLMTMRPLEKAATVHGLRSAFPDGASERTNFAREICEAALVHIVKDKTEAAYRRGDLFEKAPVMIDALTWAGTFHGIGARLLREYSDQIGLDQAFTIHDREDAADLMNLTRHDLGFSKTVSRFPTKGTCLSIYSRCVNAEVSIEQVLGTSFPWCSGWATELKRA